MSLIFQSLNAVTVTGAGAVVAYDKPRRVTMQVIVTGSPSGLEVDLEQSLDGTNFISIGNTSSPNNMTLASSFAPYARANLVSLSGGTSPTVTAWLAAEDE